MRFAKTLDGNAALLFYLDDGYLVIDPARLDEVMQVLERTFGTIGMELNAAKTNVWTPPGSLSPRLMRPGAWTPSGAWADT